MSGRRPRLSVIVPSWNGGELLERLLPEVVPAVEGLPGGGEVIVADDATEIEPRRTEAAVAAAGGTVRLLRAPSHRGFGPTCNLGARAARGSVLVFLNSDMHPVDDCLVRLVRGVEEHGELFALSPVIENVAGGFFESGTRLLLRRGLLDVDFPGRRGEPPPAAGGLRRIAYACGGALACRAERFESLGGFWDALAPFYWEDAELGLRALTRGWGCGELGGARALHDHARTIGAHHSPREVRVIYERNRLLVSRVYASDPSSRRWRRLVGPARLAWHLLRRSPGAGGLVAARGRGDAVRARRPPAVTDTLADALRAARAGGWPS